MKEIKYRAFTRDGLYLHESTRVIGCKFFNIRGLNPDHHGIEIHGDGTLKDSPTYIIENCVIDNTGVKPNSYDEGVALVNAPNVIFNRVRFANLGKSCLVGNGDYIEEDKNLRVVFNECIFENCGRRNPFIQYGKAILNNCLIKNWGDSKYFYLKSHGLRVGEKAECVVNSTIFWQNQFWPGLKNFITDIFNQYDPLFLPGNFRGAYAETGGKLELNQCYKNSKFVWLQGKNKNPMSKKEALEKIKYLEDVVPTL